MVASLRSFACSPTTAAARPSGPSKLCVCWAQSPLVLNGTTGHPHRHRRHGWHDLVQHFPFVLIAIRRLKSDRVLQPPGRALATSRASSSTSACAPAASFARSSTSSFFASPISASRRPSTRVMPRLSLTKSWRTWAIATRTSSTPSRAGGLGDRDPYFKYTIQRALAPRHHMHWERNQCCEIQHLA
jgi:hypothetical protein